MVFQMVRSIFADGYTASWHALDIAFNETADRPTTRANDDGFAAWSPGEAMLSDWSDLPFEWMEGEDDAACFAALTRLPRADKERLFAAAVARTVKGQLAFEHDARPELEATVARLGIDFAKHVRPTAAMLWSRITKGRILDVARETFGAAWAAARSKYKKADLAKSMEAAFAAGPPPVGLGATAHAAALAWTMPGFAAFDAGGDARRGRRHGARGRHPARWQHAGRLGRYDGRPRRRGQAAHPVGGREHRVPGRRRPACRRPHGREVERQRCVQRRPGARRRRGSGRLRPRQRPRRAGPPGGRGRSGAGERRRRRGPTRRSVRSPTPSTR